MNIRIIPKDYGVGFCSSEPLPKFADKYREEQVGRYWNYTYDLAQNLGTAYHSERVIGGRCEFAYAMHKATNVLASCISQLGMFELTTV